MPQAILFDLYGTLLVYGDMGKAWSGWIRAMGSALDSLGVRLGEQELRSRCDGFFSRPVEPFAGLVPYECRMRSLALELGAEPSLGWCRLSAKHSMADWQREIPLDTEALPLLKALRAKGVRLGVLTNFDYPSHVRELLEIEGLMPCLDAVVVSGEENLKKPDPRLFALALERLGCKAKDTVFVGDHPDQDIRGALQAGLRAVLVNRGGLKRDHVDFHIDGVEGVAGEGGHVARVPEVSSLLDLLPLLDA